MTGWAERVRSDPAALTDQPAKALHEVLDEVADAFSRRPPPLWVELPSDRPVQVIGDSHGDWPAVASALAFARRGPVPERFVGLGDYIHRATRSQPDPAALPSGSVWNATFLLAWAAHAPDEVILLQGNHEATRRIPVSAPTLLRELRRAYPREEAMPLFERLMSLLEALPVAARTANGVFLAHGGPPPPDRLDPRDWSANDLGLLEGLLWSDPEVDHEERPAGYPYGARDLERFLRSVDCRLMIKGHAPGHSGRAIYHGRLLTVHTSDLFAGFGEGGVFLAEIPAVPRVEDARSLTLRSWDGSAWNVRPVVLLPSEPAEEVRPPPRAKGPRAVSLEERP